MNLEQALLYIHQTSWQGQPPGLTRIRTLLHALGNPHKQLQFVHVAGTNGKGSTCACMATILTAAGYTVGLNTSPYIHRFHERIQVCGEEISDQDLIALVEAVAPVVASLSIRPTEFELITALAMVYFVQKNCDIVVLEVGLGGELDASNVIDCPAVAVITALGLDHTALLGHTMEAIASAKAGIIKAGGTVVYQGGDATALAVITQRCQALGASLHVAEHSRILSANGSLLSPSVTLSPYGTLALGLAGSYQPENALMAVTAVEELVTQGWVITPDHIAQGLAQVRWPGRFQVLQSSPWVILDGAHNPQGMATTLQAMAQALPGQPPQVVLGVMADKDIAQILALVAPVAAHIHCVTPPNSRALSAQDLALALQALGATATSYDTVHQAMDRAVTLAGPQGGVMALGSLYLCQAVLDWTK